MGAILTQGIGVAVRNSANGKMPRNFNALLVWAMKLKFEMNKGLRHLWTWIIRSTTKKEVIQDVRNSTTGAAPPP